MKKHIILRAELKRREFPKNSSTVKLGYMKKILYGSVGDDYDTKDPVKIQAQKAAAQTAKNLAKNKFEEIEETRGESAFVWRQKDVLMACVIEGLGTKNLIADEAGLPSKTYYDVIAHDTVATIINDLVTVGAKPIVINAYWAIGDNEWLKDKQRLKDLISGWKRACDVAGATWAGGETPTLKGLMRKDSIELGGSAVGVIKSEKRLITERKLKVGDRILFLRSNGINANGVSLARAVAKKLSKGYQTKLPDGKTFGAALLTKSNIYASLIQNLLDEGVDIHYISNITGHGLRKVMRAKGQFTYILEKIFPPQEVFQFIQKQAGLSDYEMYDTYNMGMDYAIFLPEKYVKRAEDIIRKNKFKSLDVGYVEKGKRQVVIKPKNIIFKSGDLDLRA